MNTGIQLVGVLSVILMSGSTVMAQIPMDVPYLRESAPTTPLPEGVTPSVAQPVPMQTQPWMNGSPAGCCGPVGGSGPIGTDLYVRTGPSFIVAGGEMREGLNTGWEVMAGGRSLFFNPEGSGAWVVDLGVGYTYNNGGGGPVFNVLGTDHTIRSLSRTALSLGFGYDWFDSGPGFWNPYQHKNWSYGVDAGARWGTAHLALNPVPNPTGYTRIQDVYGACFIGAQTNLEIPMGGSWSLMLGLRTEFSYSFMEFIPGRSADLYDINVLMTAGVRF